MEQTETDDLVLQARRKAIEKTMKEYPVLGEFSPEQYASDSQSMGAVFVPDFRLYQKFSNLKGRHLKALFWTNWMNEVRDAAVQRRRLEFEKVIANFTKDISDINGWSANMYLRTGLEALRANPMPTQKLGWRERRRLKKQGGW